VSIFTRLIDWIDARVDRPADQTVLDDPRGGSERIIEADSPEVGKRPAKTCVANGHSAPAARAL
jgi:hypothetical protein